MQGTHGGELVGQHAVAILQAVAQELEEVLVLELGDHRYLRRPAAMEAGKQDWITGRLMIR